MEELAVRLLEQSVAFGVMAFAWRMAEMRYAYERARVKEYATELKQEREREIQRLQLLNQRLEDIIPPHKIQLLVDEYENRQKKAD